MIITIIDKLRIVDLCHKENGELMPNLLKVMDNVYKEVEGKIQVGLHHKLGEDIILYFCDSVVDIPTYKRIIDFYKNNSLRNFLARKHVKAISHYLLDRIEIIQEEYKPSNKYK